MGSKKVCVLSERIHIQQNKRITAMDQMHNFGKYMYTFIHYIKYRCTLQSRNSALCLPVNAGILYYANTSTSSSTCTCSRSTAQPMLMSINEAMAAYTQRTHTCTSILTCTHTCKHTRHTHMHTHHTHMHTHSTHTLNTLHLYKNISCRGLQQENSIVWE